MNYLNIDQNNSGMFLLKLIKIFPNVRGSSGYIRSLRFIYIIKQNQFPVNAQANEKPQKR